MLSRLRTTSLLLYTKGQASPTFADHLSANAMCSTCHCMRTMSGCPLFQPPPHTALGVRACTHPRTLSFGWRSGQGQDFRKRSGLACHRAIIATSESLFCYE